MIDHSLKELTTQYNGLHKKKIKLGQRTRASLIFALWPLKKPDYIAILQEKCGDRSGETPRQEINIFRDRKSAKKWLKATFEKKELEHLAQEFAKTDMALDSQVSLTSNQYFRTILKGDVMKKSSQKKVADKIKKNKKATKKTAVKKNGEWVTLKELCDDPSTARQVLRKAVKDKKLKHDPNGRWEWKKKDPNLTKVKKLVKGI